MTNRNQALCGIALTLSIALRATAATCESLSSLGLPNTTITIAQPVPAVTPTAPAGRRGGATAPIPAHCRVAATIRPTADSEIKIEVWLPADNWNGKLEANGNGGWTGSINAATLAAGVRQGYVAAMSDLGHEGGSASFALGHPEKMIDFGYRAAHELTIAAKAITASYYGNAPKLSYWTRQAAAPP